MAEAVDFSLATSARSAPTPYTGSSGVAYALWRAGTLLGRPEWQQQAAELSAAALRRAAHVVDASVLDGERGYGTSGHTGNSFVRLQMITSKNVCCVCLCAGRAGVLLVHTLLQHSANSSDTAASALQPLLAQHSAICASAAQPGSGDSDEFLYGR